LLAARRIEEVRELRVGGDLLLVLRRLDRLGERRLRVLEARLLEVAADEARGVGVVLVARIGGEHRRAGRLGLLEQAALTEAVRERAQGAGVARLHLDRLADRR